MSGITGIAPTGLWPQMAPPCQACGAEDHGHLRLPGYDIMCPDVAKKAFAEFEAKNAKEGEK